MASTVFPAASSAVTDNWVQIATSTPTSGSTVSFTSIPTTYRKLWIITPTRILLGSSGYLYAQTNSITAADSYRWFAMSGTSYRVSDEPGIYNYPSATNDQIYISFYITNKNNSIPFATFEGFGSGGSPAQTLEGGWINSLTTPITQIDITTTTTFAAGNTGAITLYGTL